MDKGGNPGRSRRLHGRRFGVESIVPYGLVRDAIRGKSPRSAAYLAYLKALLDNEIELRLLPWLCDPSGLAIDVGAYTGTYSTGLSLFSRSVIAVEPQPWQAARLRSSMPANVDVIEAALSDRTGTADLSLSSADGGSMSTLSPGKGALGWSKRQVAVTTIDTVANDNVAFVKIDAEGHELEVLQGAADCLHASRPNLLIEIEERNRSGSLQSVFALLRDFGYEGMFVAGGRLHSVAAFVLDEHQDVSRICGGARRTYADYINNFIFIHRDRRIDVPDRVPSGARAVATAIAALTRRALG